MRPGGLRIWLLIAAGTSFAFGVGVTCDGPLYAANEQTKDVIAAQIRKQGFACNNPQSAERESTVAGKIVWILKCEGATYRVHLIPNQAASVERLN